MISSSLYNRIEGPFSIDENKLLDEAISAVSRDPEILAAIQELPHPIDIASKVQKHRKEILHNITDPLDRARSLGDRLHNSLISSDEYLQRLVSSSSGLRSVQRGLQDAPREADHPALLTRARQQRTTAESLLLLSPRKHLRAALRAITPQPSGPSRGAEGTRAALENELGQLEETLTRIDESMTERLDELGPEVSSQDLDFRTFEGQWAAARREISQTLERAVQSFALTVLNSELVRQYDPCMRVRSAEGLREPLTRDKIVRTPAFDRLDVMMRQRQGASFGISGPRGVGKTTLIDFFTKLDGVSVGRPNGKRRLGAQVSAPVQYDGREFVLHLHAELCRAIIGSDSDQVLQTPGATVASYRTPLLTRVTAALLSSLLQAGAVALLLYALWVQPAPENSLTWVGVGLSAVATMLLGLLLAGIATLTVNAIGSDLTSRGRVVPTSVLGQLRRRARRLLLVCTAFTYFATSAAALLVLATPHWPGTPAFLLGGMTFALGLSLSGVAAGALTLLPPTRPETPVNPLSHTACSESLHEAAVAELRRIRFQQSFSSERSMGAKVGAMRRFPMMLEAGAKQGTTWAERQRTFPEIVLDLVNFLGRVVEECHVVIAIDELDKMQDPDDAQRFLNDIKGVFAARDCFFLVSVSEDAAGTFERRGAPFRDAFDSSFDDMVTLDRLTLADARQVLYGLLFGWTEPFIGLCYVLSGGLPRDLHRSARGVIGGVFGEDGDEKSEIVLETAMLDVFQRECRGRLRAVRKSLTSESLDEAGISLLELLDPIEPDERPSGKQFREWHEELRQWTSHRGRSAVTTPQPRAVRLARELEAFLYFVSTVFDFFAPEQISTRMREARTAVSGRKSLDRLAAARHAISLDPSASLCLTKGFRKAWDLDASTPSA